MRRFGRWIFNGLAALSLLLCVATAALWLRSYWTVDAIFHLNPLHRSDVYSDRGTLCLDITSTDESRNSSTAWRYWHIRISSDRRRHLEIGEGQSFLARLGVGYLPNYLTLSGSSGAQFFLPHWLFCVMFLIAPVIRRRRWLRNRPLRQTGHCVSCGYDLRATPDRCPECGTPIENAVQAKR
jgi:4-amino-4-deoxy-L-arabinose transferase-like glycosyltransferase